MIEQGISTLAGQAFMAGFAIAEASMVLVMSFFLGLAFVRKFTRV